MFGPKSRTSAVWISGKMTWLNASLTACPGSNSMGADGVETKTCLLSLVIHQRQCPAIHFASGTHQDSKGRQVPCWVTCMSLDDRTELFPVRCHGWIASHDALSRETR